MNQLDRHPRGTRHPAVAPPEHHDNQRVKIDPFLRQPILETTWMLLVLDSDQDPIAHQFAQAMG
jgi:hypothetical protein